MPSGNKRNASQISSASSSSSKKSNDDKDNYVELPLYGEHTRAVSAIAFAPKSQTYSYSSYPSSNQTLALCASASADGTVRLWDIQKQNVESFLAQDGDDKDHDNTKTLMTPTVCLAGHSRGVNDVCWSPRTSEIIATASDDKTLRIFDVTRGSGPSQSILDSIPSPTCANPNPSSSPSSSNHNTHTQNHNETQTLQGETLVEFKGHSNFCFSVKFSPQGNLLVSGSFDETVKIWDVRSGECVATLPAHSDPVTGVDFNRDGTCIVSSSHDGLIRIWDVATGECLKTIYAEGNPPVTFVKYSPNGKFILSGTLDGKLRLWNVAGNFASLLDRGRGVGMANGSNSGGGLGISTTQGRGGQCTKTYHGGHVNSKYCIFSAFNVSNPKRQSVVTGSEDGNVYLYDLQTRGVAQVLENAHSDACLAVAAHDSLELLASGGMSNDKTVRFWMPKSFSM